MKDATDRYISAQKVAEILSCTDQYVYSLIREGTLDAIKIGPRALRISERSLNAFINAGRVDPEDYFAPGNTGTGTVATEKNSAFTLDGQINNVQ